MKTAKASWITSYYDDFMGEDWKESYFKLLSWKNTWGIPYRMDINSTSSHKAYLSMSIPVAYTEQVRELLYELGYTKIDVYDATIGLISPDYDGMIDDYVIWEE